MRAVIQWTPRGSPRPVVSNGVDAAASTAAMASTVRQCALGSPPCHPRGRHCHVTRGPPFRAGVCILSCVSRAALHVPRTLPARARHSLPPRVSRLASADRSLYPNASSMSHRQQLSRLSRAFRARTRREAAQTSSRRSMGMHRH
jgi:hypothetical protein